MDLIRNMLHLLPFSENYDNLFSLIATLFTVLRIHTHKHTHMHTNTHIQRDKHKHTHLYSTNTMTHTCDKFMIFSFIQEGNILGETVLKAFTTFKQLV